MKTTPEAINDLMQVLNDFCFRKGGSDENCGGCCFENDVEDKRCPLGNFYDILNDKYFEAVANTYKFEPCDKFKIDIRGIDITMCKAYWSAAKKWSDIATHIVECCEEKCPIKHPELLNGHNLEEL